MTKLATSMSIDPARACTGLHVDGEPFPWHILADSVTVEPASHGMSVARVNLTLLVDGPIHLWPKP